MLGCIMVSAGIVGMVLVFPHFQAEAVVMECASATAVAVAKMWRVLTSLFMFMLLIMEKSFELSTIRIAK